MHQDLIHYLHSLRFWGIADVSRLCVWFVLLRDEYCLADLVEFDKAFSTLTVVIDLLKVKENSDRLSKAVALNHFTIVDCMVSLGYPVSSAHCDAAAKLPTSAVLELLHSRKSRGTQSVVSFETVKTALRAGNIEAVRFLEKEGLNMQSDLNAVTHVNSEGNKYVVVGNMSCMIYTLEHGCMLSALTAKNCAACNMLDCLQYAHEHGCPWDENTTISAATYGALSCLKYAYEHGCPTTTAAYTDACVYKHPDCAAFLKDKV